MTKVVSASPDSLRYVLPSPVQSFKEMAAPGEAPKERRLEAAPGFEPGVRVLQTHALPLGYAAAC